MDKVTVLFKHQGNNETKIELLQDEVDTLITQYKKALLGAEDAKPYLEIPDGLDVWIVPVAMILHIRVIQGWDYSMANVGAQMTEDTDEEGGAGVRK